MNKILESEEYVCIPPVCKDTLEYKIAHNVKEEIRKHKYNKGTEGVELTWEDAREEWLDLYYEDFVSYLMETLCPKRKSKRVKRFSKSMVRDVEGVSLFTIKA